MHGPTPATGFAARSSEPDAMRFVKQLVVHHEVNGVPRHPPVVEFAITAGFLGLFYLVFDLALRRHPAVPLKDPRLQECLEYPSA